MFYLVNSESGRQNWNKLYRVWMCLPGPGSRERGLTNLQIADKIHNSLLSPQEVSRLLQILKRHGQAYCRNGKYWRQTEKEFLL